MSEVGTCQSMTWTLPGSIRPLQPISRLIYPLHNHPGHVSAQSNTSFSEQSTPNIFEYIQNIQLQKYECDPAK
jgi:hypothetical protein